jgi:hypothetical protein
LNLFRIGVISAALSLFISCSKNERITYVVTGDSPNVKITTDYIYSTITVTDLPWWDERHETVTTYDMDGDTDYSNHAEITAVNASDSDSSVTVMIFVNGKEKSSQTSRGPRCTAHAYVDLFELEN